ncbi:tRNA lysidine(34) synthetase TilS [Alteraurantiacibacter aquimixticola]|uniref:tRNA(Ile)-lysidine synthase n=1 Tax=Alteraurantiacibacter aquimixticola TaxID=2489173 RepID=A0A4T3F4E7_9SPHN|nr:tRNA lysidine(34) synthetase TilS [Alteraurantiacibacter aquimixticola]TIX51204.1 tRNA lysidine(34) synthetase TilS [Alteraurantiacibacter aquimixticola]
MTPAGAVSTASDPIPPELVERFRAALERLNPEGGKIGLAVSGGPDSMAMLLLAHAVIPGQFEVATVDHGLRPEAKDECALVIVACTARGIPCEVLRVEVGEGNLLAKARKARYEVLGGWAERRRLGVIATAHHADDQVETLLMRLNRGVGVTGLSGIRERVTLDEAGKVTLIRPVLDFTRRELFAVVQSAAQRFVEDPSNADADFERVRMRQALEGVEWLEPRMLAASARHLAEADDALWWASDIAWHNNSRKEDGLLRIHPIGPRAIRMRLLGHALFEFGGDPEGGDLARLLDRLERGEGGNLAGVLVTVDGEEWVVRPEPPRKTG